MTMNKTLKLLTIGIISILIGFQYWIVLHDQKAPPSKEWSRTFPSNVNAGNYAKMQTVPTETGYATSLLDFKKMDFLDCSKDMQCTHKWSESDLDPYKNTWSDGHTTYFINENSLIRSTTNEDNETISQNVENFTKSDKTLVYWSTDQQFTIQQNDNQPVSHSTEFPIYNAMIINEHVFVFTKDKESNFTVFDATSEIKELFQFDLNTSDNLISMQISTENNTQFSFILDIEIIAGGSRNKVIRAASFDLSEKQKLEFNTLKYVDKDSGNELFDIRTPFMFGQEIGTKITFTANMFEHGKKVNKVFAGNYHPSLIEASAVTKKGDIYVRPIFVNAETIAYFKVNGTEKQLMYSSSNDAQQVLSDALQKGDAKEGFYTLVSLLFTGIVLLLLAFTWLIPALGIGYVTLAILKKQHKPYAYLVALLVNTIALVITQLVLFATIFHPERIVLKAPYLTETWHVYLVIVIAGIGCLLPVFLSRLKVTYDNSNQLFLYTSLLNLIILFLLLGPYFI
jgi:hypothetical protein